MSCGLLLPELLVRVPQGMVVEATRSHCGDHGTLPCFWLWRRMRRSTRRLLLWHTCCRTFTTLIKWVHAPSAGL